MSKRGKSYRAAKEAFAAKPAYPVDEAIQKVKETAKTKFDSSVELHIRLGIDASKSDQMVRGSVMLPHGTGKSLRVIAFVSPDQEKDARDAGADLIGDQEMIKTIQTTKKCDFDVAVATPPMMKALAPVAKILGQKGLMPNPRTETVGPNVKAMITALKTGKITFKSDDTGNLHQIVGKVSFDNAKLKANIDTYVDAVKRAKPDGVKGVYLKKVVLCTTMGPSLGVML
ncbi:MAG: 50S ribosomal protein L1 [Candidatus Kerfeldbacteria bacterium]|nr:50S ribosomal protein L1 [Candidatus Kerfeldbacteria bacterium]